MSRYAQVVLDIPTRQLDDPFDYKVPESWPDEALTVGMTVLVPLQRRHVVGYVLSVTSQPTNTQLKRIVSITQVLAPAAFDEKGAVLIRWISRTYACPLAEAVKPFLAPGQHIAVRKNEETGLWELEAQQSKPLDRRWARLVDFDFVPRSSASKQKAILSALQAGPQMVRELNALIPGASSTLKALEQKGVVACYASREVRGFEETSLRSAQAPKPSSYTQGQLEALRIIAQAQVECFKRAQLPADTATPCTSAPEAPQALQAPQAHPGHVVVIDGVTGSGKTEVYLSAIEETLKQGKTALVLVPEISLTAQTVGRFRSRFGNDVAVLHSRLSDGERFDQWDQARIGAAHVVVGARSALFCPLKNLGLIVIDEEHEQSYKQDSSPRYHAREVAQMRAHLEGACLVLGSATPSLEALARCKQGSFQGDIWTRTSMYERPGTAQLPRIELVNLTGNNQAKGSGAFSVELKDALLKTLEADQKAVLLLNRRGFSNFLMCQDCGCVPTCPHCSTSLTYHEQGHLLMCHSCNRSWSVVAYPNPHTRCPNCGSRYMGAYGLGTQQVEAEFKGLVDDPQVTIIRMDADTTRTKGAHQALLEAFDAAPKAVLIGTQMIAKGLDFPEVTLVGVINADTTLKMPDIRAAERTYDLLEQVAGRAGRGDKPGRVIIQSYWTTHPALQAVAAHRRDVFVQAELQERQEFMYPPFGRLSNVIVWGPHEQQVERCAEAIATGLIKQVTQASEFASFEVLGPTPCLKSKVKDQFRYHVMVKSPLESEPGVLLGSVVKALGPQRGISIAIDVDAYDVM